MRRVYLLLLTVVIVAITNAQVAITVTGNTNTAPNLAASYTSLANAITDLSSITAISGPVTLTCATSGTETAPAGGYVINFTAITTATNNVVIDGSASIITAPTPQVIGNLNDAIFKIIGSDYVTIQGFTMLENGANTTTSEGTNNMSEWGVALLYASTTNGAQNCIIQNNTITLNRTYQNTFGIYSNSTHSASAVTVSATATTTAGGNSGLKIYGNTISNVNNGIVVVGPTAAADINNAVDIGGISGSTANSISNYGTTGTFSAYANVSASVYAVLVRNSKTNNVSFNSITSSAGGVTSGTLRGIYVPSFSGGAAGTFINTINNNTISLTGGVASGILQGIAVETTTGNSTTTLNINNNNFTAATFSIASSGVITLISDAMANRTTTISGNSFTNIVTNTTGNFTFISHDFAIPSTGSLIINDNSIITAFNKTGAGGTVTLTTSNSFSGTGGTVNNYTNNNFSNITVTGSTGITGLWNSDGYSGPTKTITGNTFNNWTGGTASIIAMTFYEWNGVSSLSGNTITNITGQSNVIGIIMSNNNTNLASSISVSSNIITNLTSTGTGNNVTGITCSNLSTVININGNTINTFSSTGSFSTVTGIAVNGATTTNVFQNTIHTLSGSATLSPVCNGISVSSGSTINIYKNKIYNLLESGAFTASSPVVNGILISGGTTVTTYNNLIGDLRATAVSSTDAIRGISITSTAVATTQNIYYNTVYLNASTTGTNFGTTGIFHTASVTATTVTLNLRNNIFANNSTPKGTGLVVAYRRSSGAVATLANYASTSNNNLFYAGTPAAGNLIYSDGTGSAQTLAAYKAGVFTAGIIAQRDNASVSENPPFVTTNGVSAGFLQINSFIATQVESQGADISTFTDDYFGDIRNTTTPDIGADEGIFILTDITGPGIIYTALPNTLCTIVTLNATITDAIGVNTTAGTKPRLWYRKASNSNSLPGTNDNTTDGWKYTEASNASSPFSFTFDYSLLNGGVPIPGDMIHYFIVAQDLNSTPNLSINAGAFTTVPPTVALNAGTFPVSGNNNYTLLPPVLTSVTIGVAGNYTSLTGVAGLFAAINAGGLIGNTTVTILDAAITETGTVALNQIYDCGGPFTLTIVPNTGVAAVLSGSVAGPLIDLNGADYVIIDGLNTNGSSLTISNTATGASSTIRFIADASNNTIQNCTLKGSTTTYGVVYFSTGSVTGNDGNNINQCTITSAGSNLPIRGIYSFGTSDAVDNSSNIISANNISDYFNATTSTAGISISGYNTTWTITNNRLFQTATRLYTATATHYGIVIASNGSTISGNIIGFANSGGTGTTNMVGNSVPLSGTFPTAYNITGTPITINYIGIYYGPTLYNGPGSNIHGNIIAGFALYTGGSNWQKNGVWCGIYSSLGYVNIGTTAGNTIGSTAGTGSVYVACTVSGAAVVGIYATSNHTLNIQNNTIGAIDAMGTTASVCGSITGINTGTIGDIDGYKIGDCNISGNTIGNSTNPNLRMGNLKTGSFLSNTGTTFSASSGESSFEGIFNFQTGAIVIGTQALPNIIRNVYQNSTSSSLAYARCIHDYDASSLTISNNTITEITSKGSRPNGIDPAIVLGISSSSEAPGQIIELNTISGLRAVSSNASNLYLIGIINSGGGNSTGIVRKNKIFDLTVNSTGTLPQIIGIYSAYSYYTTGWTYSNNMISLTNGANTNPVQIIGILNSVAYSFLYTNYYFNTVNIGGSASSGAMGSFAFLRTGNCTINHRNNLYTNTRTGGTAIHYTIYFSSATPVDGWSATASDNNVFNNAGSIIGHWGTTNVNLADWQTNSSGDNNSLSGIPLTFVNAATGDLHLNMGVTPTPIESGGVAVSGIAIDYDNETRPGPVGSVNGGATAPDIGADEFDGVHLTTIYTFNGNGNWSDAANWVNLEKPPSTVSTGYQIIIDPVAGGQCVLDIVQHLAAGTIITVRTGKTFLITGALMKVIH